ncbi:MAG TPA: hypothetical protein VG126_13965 [Thermoleophilaceae bacterium]|nr:hypothetical protein [Thermoleophilaceae bacterium]
MTEREPRQPSVPADPSGIEEPHDVLAADEFGIGTREGRLPPDPTGIQEPHDVLAAEEFAMPAGAEPHGETSRPDPRTLIPLVLLAALAAFLLLRRRT